MAEVRIRFYGRFVLAEPSVGGLVNVLAPNMRFKKTAKRTFERHEVLLSIPRSAVSSSETTLAPTYRMMSDRDAAYAECFVWDLAGCHVTVPPVDKFSLKADKVPDLKELEHRLKRVASLDPGSLTAKKKGQTKAVIQVAAGKGTAVAAFPNQSHYVTRPDAEDGNLDNDKPVGDPEQHADIVEFVVALPKPDVTLRLEIRGAKGSHGATDYIVIDTNQFLDLDPKGTLRATISNLCPALPGPRDYDHEFGQYYELLNSPKNDRLIPKNIPAAGADGDCNDPSKITYEV